MTCQTLYDGEYCNWVVFQDRWFHLTSSHRTYLRNVHHFTPSVANIMIITSPNNLKFYKILLFRVFLLLIVFHLCEQKGGEGQMKKLWVHNIHVHTFDTSYFLVSAMILVHK